MNSDIGNPKLVEVPIEFYSVNLRGREALCVGETLNGRINGLRQLWPEYSREVVSLDEATHIKKLNFVLEDDLMIEGHEPSVEYFWRNVIANEIDSGRKKAAQSLGVLTDPIESAMLRGRIFGLSDASAIAMSGAKSGGLLEIARESITTDSWNVDVMYPSGWQPLLSFVEKILQIQFKPNPDQGLFETGHNTLLAAIHSLADWTVKNEH